MQVAISDIKDGCLEQQLTFAAADFPVLIGMQQQNQIAAIKQPIKFALRLQKTGQLVEVDGRYEFSVELSCGRCLQDYALPLSGEFALTFTPYPVDKQQPEEADAEVELESDELGLIYYQDESLELLPALQDQLVMALPISPVCSEDCHGLCSECGCNLNLTSCNCEKKVFNDKFSALADIKIESSDKS